MPVRLQMRPPEHPTVYAETVNVQATCRAVRKALTHDNTARPAHSL